MKKNRKVVIEGITSAYDFGRHIVDGRTPSQIRRDEETKHAHGSINGGYGQFMLAIERLLDNVPTGLPITITVEVKAKK